MTLEARYKSYTHSLEVLAEAKERDLSDSFIACGICGKFSITFDLAWKVMKDILWQALQERYCDIPSRLG